LFDPFLVKDGENTEHRLRGTARRRRARAARKDDQAAPFKGNKFRWAFHGF
jgi:hypothetical protein